MIRHYVEFFYPGTFVSETSVEPIERREAHITLPKGAYAYRLFSRQETTLDGETLVGKPRDYSGTVYFGEVLTAEQIAKLPGDYSILLSNMRCNDWKTVVRTVRGNFQPLLEGDTVRSVTRTDGDAP